MNKIQHLVGGVAMASTSGRTGPVYDPATGEQTGTVALAFAEEPRIHAAWLDSPFADMEKIIQSELQIAGFPAYLFLF